MNKKFDSLKKLGFKVIVSNNGRVNISLNRRVVSAPVEITVKTLFHMWLDSYTRDKEFKATTKALRGW